MSSGSLGRRKGSQVGTKTPLVDLYKNGCMRIVASLPQNHMVKPMRKRWDGGREKRMDIRSRREFQPDFKCRSCRTEEVHGPSTNTQNPSGYNYCLLLFHLQFLKCPTNSILCNIQLLQSQFNHQHLHLELGNTLGLKILT